MREGSPSGERRLQPSPSHCQMGQGPAEVGSKVTFHFFEDGPYHGPLREGDHEYEALPCLKCTTLTGNARPVCGDCVAVERMEQAMMSPSPRSK